MSPTIYQNNSINKSIDRNLSNKLNKNIKNLKEKIAAKSPSHTRILSSKINDK